MTEVVNIHHKQLYDVYVGRAGKGESGYYGNPTYSFEGFKPYFHDRLKTDAEYAASIAALKGKKLGCFCAPKECHAMIIVEYLEGKSVQDQMKEYTEKMGKEVKDDIFNDF